MEWLGRDGGFINNPKVKIPLPDALAQTEPLLRMARRGKDLDQLVTTMNRAIEASRGVMGQRVLRARGRRLERRAAPPLQTISGGRAVQRCGCAALVGAVPSLPPAGLYSVRT